MTPFGERMRGLRAARGLTQQQQADQLGVSKAYISALENGARGRPSAPFVDQICAWLGLIWDDAEELKNLAAISHPKPAIDASRSHAAAVELANLVATHIGSLDALACERLIAALKQEVQQRGR
ncbi:MAG: helix-turn-helix domain-containing protein [Candidatus Puniceispirillaceae bacterium]|jgi:transcriptional regulator with XRE-family HTH domain